MRYNFERLRKMIEKGKKERFKTWNKTLKYYINYKNSMLLDAILYLKSVKGYNEKQLCLILNIPYKAWRYYLDSNQDCNNVKIIKQSNNNELNNNNTIEANVRKVNRDHPNKINKIDGKLNRDHPNKINKIDGKLNKGSP